MAGQPVEVWLKVTTTSPPTTLKSTLEIWTVVPEQLDGEALSAHAAVMPAPESVAAMDATAIALAVRPLRNIFGPFLAMAAQGQSTLKPSGPYSVKNLPNPRACSRHTRSSPHQL